MNAKWNLLISKDADGNYRESIENKIITKKIIDRVDVDDYENNNFGYYLVEIELPIGEMPITKDEENIYWKVETYEVINDEYFSFVWSEYEYESD